MGPATIWSPGLLFASAIGVDLLLVFAVAWERVTSELRRWGMTEDSGASVKRSVFKWAGVVLVTGSLFFALAGCQDLSVTGGATSSTGTTMLTDASTWSTGTTTAEGAAPESGSGAGSPGPGSGGSGAESDEGTDTDDTLVSLPSLYVGTLVAYTTTTERAPQVFTVDRDDDGHTLGMYVGDLLRVELRPTSSNGVDDVLPSLPGNGVLRATGQVREESNAEGNIYYFFCEWEAAEPGSATLEIWYVYGVGNYNNEKVLTLYIHVVE